MVILQSSGYLIVQWSVKVPTKEKNGECLEKYQGICNLIILKSLNIMMFNDDDEETEFFMDTIYLFILFL